jgi:hypothetical protein
MRASVPWWRVKSLTEDPPSDEDCEQSQLEIELNGVKVSLVGRHALILSLALLAAYIYTMV